MQNNIMFIQTHTTQGNLLIYSYLAWTFIISLALTVLDPDIYMWLNDEYLSRALNVTIRYIMFRWMATPLQHRSLE